MASLDASAVAKLLVEFGQRIELSGDNPYRARAYYKAAESLRALAVPLDEVIAKGRLRDIPGVGAAIAERIRTAPSLTWEQELGGAGVPCAAVRTELAALPRDPCLEMLFEPIGATCRAPVAPWRFSPR